MIELQTYRTAFGKLTRTPFGVKAAILPRMADKAHKIVYVDDPRTAPKGKMPLIVDATQVSADSTVFPHHLGQAHGTDFYAGLTAEQKEGILSVSAIEGRTSVLVHRRSPLAD